MEDIQPEGGNQWRISNQRRGTNQRRISNQRGEPVEDIQPWGDQWRISNQRGETSGGQWRMSIEINVEW